MRSERYAMTPHLDYEFPESMEQTDDALAEQVREVINVLNSLVLRLQEREISIKLSPVMNHFDKTAYYVVEVHKQL